MHNHQFFVSNQTLDEGELNGCRLCALVCHLDREATVLF
jgi:hypothetical protein